MRDKTDYIEQVLRENGGQLKQQDFVIYTGWSSAAISRILNQMENNGRIIWHNIGRANMVYLPDTILESTDNVSSDTQ